MSATPAQQSIHAIRTMLESDFVDISTLISLLAEHDDAQKSLRLCEGFDLLRRRFNALWDCVESQTDLAGGSDETH